MPKRFSFIKERALKLGNHNRKYVTAAEKFTDRLKYQLEQHGVSDKVHLYQPADDLPVEMATVAGVGSDEREKLNFLGCYYSLQLLNRNIRNVDVLHLEVLSGLDRLPCYRNFMRRAGVSFRELTAAYISQLLDIFIGNDGTEFLICGVGTRADQDDIDVGIVVRSGTIGERFNQGLSRLNNEMLKRASRLHFHLSENVGRKRYYATIPEYVELLEKQVHDFVIINEMIGAKPILGSQSLFEEFREKVTRRYYHKPGEPSLHHEGFVRGIVGEIRSLILRPVGREVINPKDDALRMIKGIAFVGKAVFDIDAANAWEVLDELQEKDADRREQYRGLHRALTFLEAFRFLYQLYEVQEEEIDLTQEHVTSSLDDVARVMGYKEVGIVPAWHHLLIHYFEFIKLTRMTSDSLLGDVRRHLRENSIFTEMVSRQLEGGPELLEGENPAKEFADTLEFFAGTRFWDDVMRPLSSKDGVLLSRFIKSFQNVNQRERLRLIRRYVACSRYTMFSLLSLMMVIYRGRFQSDSLPLFNEFNAIFLRRLRKTQGVKMRMTRLFYNYPGLMNEYFHAMDRDSLEEFMRLLEGDTWDRDLCEARDRLLFFCKLHHGTSLYFKRFMDNVFTRNPKFILFLQEPQSLRQIADGFFSDVDNLSGFGSKKHKLGEYYDLEFLRVGLETMEGKPVSETNEEFTTFSDNYFQTLFNICQKEVRVEWGEKVPTNDLFAIYASGGYGREQAYDDDFDLICLLNSEDPGVMKYCTRIVAKMNKEIIKRGTMPHYRFADHFGNYVTRMSELEEFLSSGHFGDVMVECSQFLGSRLVVGSMRFDEEFQRRIITPYIFERSADYIRSIVQEVESRHEYCRQNEEMRWNLKECSGGLRDIETLLLLYKAHFNIRHNISEQFLLLVGEFDLASPAEISTLRSALNFLRNLRDVYRLVVAADDDLCVDALDEVARVLGFEDGPEGKAAERLVEEYLKTTKESAEVISRLMAGAIS